jgi:hypothetical protein
MAKPLILLIAALLAFPSDRCNAFEALEGNIHGFVSQGYLQSNHNNYFGNSSDGSFDFNEVGLNYTTFLADNLFAGVQLFARNLGRDGGDDVVIDWAFADYRIRDYFVLRAGKIKLPYGFHNDSRDIDLARTFILLPQGVYNEVMRDFVIGIWGGQVAGNVNLDFAGELDYNIYGGTLHIDRENSMISDYFRSVQDGANTAAMMMVPGAFPVTAIRNPFAEADYVYGARLIWNTPLPGLRGGVSALRAKVRVGFDTLALMDPLMSKSIEVESTIDIDSWIFSLEYIWEQLTLTAEYARFNLPIEMRTSIPEIPAVTPAMVVASTSRLDREGFYGAIEYQVLDSLTLGAYHSVFFPQKSDKSSTAERYQRDTDASIRYDYNEYIVAKAEGHYIQGNGSLSVYENMNGFDRNWWLWLLKISVSF